MMVRAHKESWRHGTAFSEQSENKLPKYNPITKASRKISMEGRITDHGPRESFAHAGGRCNKVLHFDSAALLL